MEKKEQTRGRVQRYRERQKSVTQCNANDVTHETKVADDVTPDVTLGVTQSVTPFYCPHCGGLIEGITPPLPEAIYEKLKGQPLSRKHIDYGLPFGKDTIR